MTTLGENIRRLRHAADLTGTEAADRAGISQGTWSDVERGNNTNPTTRRLERMASALGVTVADLFLDADGESVTPPD